MISFLSIIASVVIFFGLASKLPDLPSAAPAIAPAIYCLLKNLKPQQLYTTLPMDPIGYLKHMDIHGIFLAISPIILAVM